jgi:uncharacterized protein
MSVSSIPETSDPPVSGSSSPGPGHALVIGAAGFAWCSLALGLSTVGLMNAAGTSMILSGTFFYGGAGAPADGVLHAAGWAEIVLAAVAFYLVLAELANETLRRPVFPLFPFSRAAAPA